MSAVTVVLPHIVATEIRMHKNQEQLFMYINQQANKTVGARKKIRIGPQLFMQIN
jgi:hypothetical protein